MHTNKARKQTQEHKDKINTPERAKKISDTLKKLYAEGKMVCWTKGKRLRLEHKIKIGKSLQGSKGGHWKGNRAGYAAFHIWILKYYGNANKCDNRENKTLDFECSDSTNNFEWAKIKGRRYSRDREDYLQLCVSCHRKYDYVPKNRQCEVIQCNRPHSRHGFCSKHARRYEKHGHPLAVREHDNPVKYIL